MNQRTIAQEWAEKIQKLEDALATCRELRKYDRVEVERLQEKVCNRDGLIVMHKELQDSQKAEIDRLRIENAALRRSLELKPTDAQLARYHGDVDGDGEP